MIPISCFNPDAFTTYQSRNLYNAYIMRQVLGYSKFISSNTLKANVLTMQCVCADTCQCISIIREKS